MKILAVAAILLSANVSIWGEDSGDIERLQIIRPASHAELFATETSSWCRQPALLPYGLSSRDTDIGAASLWFQSFSLGNEVPNRPDVQRATNSHLAIGVIPICPAGLVAGRDAVSFDSFPIADMTSSREMISPSALPISSEHPRSEVKWVSLVRQSLNYLAVMHAFRIATEPSTRAALPNPVVGGYFQALGAMHGWSDGDGYYENYLGHPIEGAVSGYIWIHNDPRYRIVEFGGSRDYWMSRLRAYVFAWAFSEQFEIGLLSEASIGQIQRYCCAYGFVDHVITPNGGMIWMIGGDILDRYVVRSIEDHTRNRVVRILARGVLNPPLSFANLMTGQLPWHRENRASVSDYNGQLYLRVDNPPSQKRQIPTFEMTATLPSVLRFDRVSCIGGGGVAAFQLNDFWQWTVEASGCTLGNFASNWSGDSLTFTTGPQWISHSTGRWSPHFAIRVGGQKVTQEYVNPILKKIILGSLPPGTNPNKVRNEYTTHYETTGVSLSISGGADLRLNQVMALRVANLDYVRSWLSPLNGYDFTQGYRISTGLVLRIGTW